VQHFYVSRDVFNGQALRSGAISISPFTII
jgi:hypothetical protein